jgi:hypothetical protein
MRKSRLVTGALPGAAVLAVPAGAAAAIPDCGTGTDSGTGQINACYAASNGALRVIDAGGHPLLTACSPARPRGRAGGPGQM